MCVEKEVKIWVLHLNFLLHQTKYIEGAFYLVGDCSGNLLICAAKDCSDKKNMNLSTATGIYPISNHADQFRQIWNRSIFINKCPSNSLNI